LRFDERGVVRLSGGGAVVRHERGGAVPLARLTFARSVAVDGTGAVAGQCLYDKPNACQIVRVEEGKEAVLLQASGILSVRDVELDDDTLYWIDDEVRSCRRRISRGTAPSICAEMGVDEERRLFSAKKTPRSMETLLARGNLPLEFKVGTHAVLWIHDGALWSLPKLGGERRRLRDAPEGTSFALSGDSIFVAGPRGVEELDGNGVLKKAITEEPALRGIAVDDESVFWIDSESGVVRRHLRE